MIKHLLPSITGDDGEKSTFEGRITSFVPFFLLTLNVKQSRTVLDPPGSYNPESFLILSRVILTDATTEARNTPSMNLWVRGMG